MDFSFFNKDKQAKQDTIFIISQNQERLSFIEENLNLKGALTTSKLIDLFTLDSSLVPKNIQALVADCSTLNKDVNEYIEAIYKLFPRGIPYIILGDNDSIIIYQEFLKRGIFYLHYESQMNIIYDQIINYQNQNSYSGFIKVSVLGVKGGVGASSIAYSISKIIFDRYKNSVLCVQGIDSSFNLDLLSGRTFDMSDYKDNDISLYKELREGAYDFYNDVFKKYNFVIFDHSIQGLDKDEIEHILNNSDSCVIVLDQNLSAIRKAKEILKSNKFLTSVNQGAKKILLCLNKVGSPSGDSLNPAKIEELLESRIDVLIPNQNKLGELKISPNSKMQQALDLITNKLVGQKQKIGIFRKQRMSR